MIKNGQVKRLLRELANGVTLAQAAARAGLSEKTARKYRDAKRLPSEMDSPKRKSTRKDPFHDVWSEVKAFLEECPGLQAKTLFLWLQRTHPGRFAEGQLRTLQRRIKRWRQTAGPPKTVFFEQVHAPGKLFASDFTHMTNLGVTIEGQPFAHLVYHGVLTYSNWESVTLCQSESFEALSEGLQDAFWRLGGVPRRHRSDSLSAAIKNLGSRQEFTDRYQALMRHYHITPENTNVRCPHENGDVESAHGHFKNIVDQMLMLRGSRDFAGREEYASFLQEVAAFRNAGRGARLEEDLAALGKLPSSRLDSFKRVWVKVDSGSLVHLDRNVYSVDSRLIGAQLEARLFADEVQLWQGSVLRCQIPRLRGKDKHRVDYRHIIDSLIAKPAAFENYRYQADLFPTTYFRLAYDELVRRHASRVACREYLTILKLAADEGESLVQDALRKVLNEPRELTSSKIAELVRRSQAVPTWTEVVVEAANLFDFDSLFFHMEVFDDTQEVQSFVGVENDVNVFVATTEQVGQSVVGEASVAGGLEAASLADVPE